MNFLAIAYCYRYINGNFIRFSSITSAYAFMIESVLSFFAGILIVQYLSTLPSNFWLLVAASSAVILLRFRCWLPFMFVTGFVWASIYGDWQLNKRLAERLAGQNITVEGFINDLPEVSENRVRFNFKVDLASSPIPDQLRLSWYYPKQALKSGQHWRFTVRLKPPHGNFNPGGFDYERWLFVEGIGATGYVRDSPNPLLLANKTKPYHIRVWRQTIADRLDTLLSDNPSLALIKALTIGDGNALSPQQWNVFRLTGTTHLMVISGSHIGLIAAFTYLLISQIWTRWGSHAYPARRIASFAAIWVALLYAGLTGFAVPAQRSVVMIFIAMLVLIRQRNAKPYQVLVIALLVILLFDPLVVLLPGFWLSFLAVGLIIYGLVGRLRQPGTLIGGLKANWFTALGLAPLLLLFFQQVPLISPIANLIAVPLIGLIAVPLALIGTLTMFAHPQAAQIIFSLVDTVLQLLWDYLTFLATIPLHSFNQPEPALWMLLFALPGVLILLAPRGIPYRWLGLVLFFPLLFAQTETLPKGIVKLTLLDVGQGLSAVIQTAHHVLIYDTGAKFSESNNAGLSVLIPYLRSQDIEKIDTLIISHGDNDHIGGAFSLIDAYQTQKLLTSVPQLLPELKPEVCKKDQSWVWDDIRFTILSPANGTIQSENDNSCVLQIRALYGSILLPGDIESNAESWLIAKYGKSLKSTLLVSPHHGSHTSSTSAFLKAVDPQLILIPAGYLNPFGHPHKDVLTRYDNLGFKWLNAAREGAIQITFNRELEVQSWRDVKKHYWNSHNLK
jgi:competence protein ComEC